MDPYLWDKTGPADPFVARLEQSLAAKRAKVKAAGHRPKPSRLKLVAMASVIAAAASVATLLSVTSSDSSSAPPAKSAASPRLPAPEEAVTVDPTTVSDNDAERPARHKSPGTATTVGDADPSEAAAVVAPAATR